MFAEHAVPIFAADHLSGALRQCEVISSLSTYEYVAERQGTRIILRGYAIVLSQDCDLDWDFRWRRGGADEGKRLQQVLFYEAQPAADVRPRVGNSAVWGRIKVNKDERFHFLERVPAAFDSLRQGIPELTVDFKNYFTLPTEELYRQLAATDDPAAAKRRTRLTTPYLEHLAQRVAVYQSRIGLPRDHESEPGTV